MNKTQDDTEFVNQEGELAEDALYKWDGNAWVQIEHTPFQGYTGEGGRFSSPDDLILGDDDRDDLFYDEPVIEKRQYPGYFGLGKLVSETPPERGRPRIYVPLETQVTLPVAKIDTMPVETPFDSMPKSWTATPKYRPQDVKPPPMLEIVTATTMIVLIVIFFLIMWGATT